jgi:kinesin family member C1
MKRKHDSDDDDADMQPRKIAALHNENGPSALPLRARTTNLGLAPLPEPKPLTKPRAPSFTQRKPQQRATSLPPVSSGPVTRSTSTRGGIVTRRGVARGGMRGGARGGTRGGARIPSGSFRPQLNQVQEEGMAELRESLQRDIHSMGQSIAAGVAADMEAERQKVTELQESQLTLSKELAAAKKQELDRRKALDSVSDEIDAIKKKHEREVMDLEIDLVRRPILGYRSRYS